MTIYGELLCNAFEAWLTSQKVTMFSGSVTATSNGLKNLIKKALLLV